MYSSKSAFRFTALTASWVLVACSNAAPPTLSTIDGGSEVDAAEPPPPGPEPTFELVLSTDKLPVLKGTSESLKVTLVRKNGFSGKVTVEESGLPSGATADALVFEGDTTEATLTVRTASTAPYSLPTAVTVSGTSGDVEVKKPLTVTVYGAPGVLDTSFAGGRVVVPVGASDDYARAMALQSDGKVVVAGQAAEHLGDFAVVRLERDGTPDAKFGDGGKVITPIGTGSDVGSAVAIQEDGKIVVVGTSVGATKNDFAIVRYETDGSLDEGFGDHGKVTTSFSDDADAAYAVVIQKDGKIVVGGHAQMGTTGLDYAIARYGVDGTLDEGFGDHGKVTTAIAANNSRDSIYALALQDVDGEQRIVAAGGEGDFSLARYRADGTLDTSFGSGGKASKLFGSVIGSAHAIAITKDNAIVVVGNDDHDFALAQLDTSGILDPEFGDGGKVVTQVSVESWDEAQGVTIESTGKIVVGGWVYEGNSSAGNFALVRYGKDGVIDETFGDAGIVVTEVAPKGKDDQGSAVLLQSDERVPIVRILMAGSSSVSNHDFAVTRYFR